MNRFWLISLALLAAGCNRTNYDCGVMEETYVHRYGVEVPANDWSQRGESGKVISILSNGVKVTQTFDQGILDGETTYTYPHSDTLERTEVFSHGNCVKEIAHNALGQPVQQKTILSPTQTQIITWYDSGAPQSEELYEATRLVQGEYFSPNHLIEAQVNNGEGNRFVRDLSGGLISVDTFAGGEIVHQKTYYPNGVPQEETPYKKHLIDGQRRTYNASGDPDTIEIWVQGVREGSTIIFQNGEKHIEIPYAHGKKHGIEQRFKEGGAVVEEITWFQGQQHGPAITHFGSNTKTNWYFKGKPVAKEAFEYFSARD